MAMRILFLALCLEAASAISTQRNNPVTDTMEGIGNTAGTVQDGTSSATGAVGADKVGDMAGGAVTGTAGAVGGVARGALEAGSRAWSRLVLGEGARHASFRAANGHPNLPVLHVNGIILLVSSSIPKKSSSSGLEIAAIWKGY